MKLMETYQQVSYAQNDDILKMLVLDCVKVENGFD